MKTLRQLLALLFIGSASAQTPVPLWTATHPNTISGVAVNDGHGQIATSCFDGNARVFNPAGALLQTVDVSPGTINQSRNCVAYRLNWLVCGGPDDYAIAVRDDNTVCHASDVPTTRTVRGISLHAKFAVAEDNTVYNLTTGASWWSGNQNQFAWLFDCCEDGPNVWTVDLDGWLKLWTPAGGLVFAKLITSEGLMSVDANTNRVVVTTARNAILVLDKSGNIITRALESSLVYQAKFTLDGKIVFGTAGDVGAKLVCWDGASVTNAAAPIGAKPKPGKGRK